MTAWILVSNTSKAKLFSTELPERPWTLVTEFDHPEGREPSREIRNTSPPGRMQSTALGGRRTAVEPRTTPKEAEAERFAKTLSDYLQSAIARRQFDYLTVVAAPHFLGLLLNTLTDQVKKNLKTTVDKDLAALDVRELQTRLGEIVFSPKPVT
jgi:protein required for attachment to host cells